MKFIIYHEIEPTFGRETKKFNSSNYEKVAMVEAETLNLAYYLTQNMDTPWVQNKGITAIYKEYKGGIRSTSVGDVVKTDSGNTFLVTNTGFKQL